MSQVIDTIGHSVSQFLLRKVVGLHLDRRLRFPQYFSRILEISQDFLLFRVHRYRRLELSRLALGTFGNELELGLAVWMLLACDGLAIRLKIELASEAHAGWNEIDAVGLIDKKGTRQWASKAWASSSYGKNRERPS